MFLTAIINSWGRYLLTSKRRPIGPHIIPHQCHSWSPAACWAHTRKTFVHILPDCWAKHSSHNTPEDNNYNHFMLLQHNLSQKWKLLTIKGYFRLRIASGLCSHFSPTSALQHLTSAHLTALLLGPGLGFCDRTSSGKIGQEIKFPISLLLPGPRSAALCSTWLNPLCLQNI